MLTTYRFDETDALLEKLKNRADSDNAEITESVKAIIDRVRREGDDALRAYSLEFDKINLTDLYLTDAEKAELVKKVPRELRSAIKEAARNITSFHKRQKRRGYCVIGFGKKLGQRVLPLGRVGLYVPGGTAAYPSSVLMNAIPAKVAGVESIVMATPPKDGGINPAAVYAAEVAGIKDILKVGGAQAIAAFAYGTGSIAPVDKIVGPGNAYVAEAKRLVFGKVDIDMIAGPSEVCVMADESANPVYVAADLMSQAEHDTRAACILIASSEEFIKSVNAEIERQLKWLSRREIIEQSLKNYGCAVVVPDRESAVRIANLIAPEHLEIDMSEPFELLDEIKNAGSIFLGEYSPEPLGDYFAGTNHVLPTNGSARFSSALSVDSFYKRSTYLCYSRKRLEKVYKKIDIFAKAEGLDAHANSVNIRFN